MLHRDGRSVVEHSVGRAMSAGVTDGVAARRQGDTRMATVREIEDKVLWMYSDVVLEPLQKLSR